MIQAERSRWSRSYEISVYSQDQVLETGLALTSLLENGKKVARRSNGTDNTIFLGLSHAEYIGVGYTLPLSTSINVPQPVGGAAYSVVPLEQVSTGVADMGVFSGTGYGGTQFANVSNANNYAAVSDDTHYALSADGRSLIVKADLAGSQLFVTQRWQPTAYYLRMMFGDMYLPTGAVDMNRIGVIQRGTIYTSAYDTSANWGAAQDFSTANVLRAGVNGRLTLNSAGAICRDCTVVSVPTASDPWLGVQIEI